MKRKQKLSFILAVVMLCCSIFGSGITGFAGINVADANEVKTDTLYTVQTTYDPSENYETAHSWVKFVSGEAGAYKFYTNCKNEDVFVMPIVMKSKADAENCNFDNSLSPEGYMVGQTSFSMVYNLAANKTYYIDIVAMNFEDETDEPTVSFKITKHTHSFVPYTEKASTADEYDGETGMACTSCNATKEVKTIPYAKTFTLSTTKYTYNGKAKKPSVTVKDRKGNVLKNGTDYTVSYPSGRTKVGKYTVTIKLKGKYEGTVKKTFSIVPKSTSITSISASKRGFTVKWKKQTTQTTGYQVQYSRYSDFTNAKSAYISKNTTTSKKVGDLLGKKKYYVRVRTYKTVDGKKIYSSWSKWRSITTKR
ncbi:MAG: hypothetical protein ACI4IL_08320 [Eubacterium sp.]